MRNPARRFLLPVLVLSLATTLGLVSIPASAFYHTLNLVLLGPEDPVGIGDRVTMTVHILNAGVHAEPTSILADLNRGRPNARIVTPIPVGVGIYQMQFDMLESDLAPGGTRVTVEATVGGLKDADWTNLVLGGLDVEIAPSVTRVSPGETVTITVQTRALGAPRDADALFVSADLLPVGRAAITTVLTSTRVSLGMYQATYAVPEDMSHEAAIAFYARAGVDGRIGSSTAYVLVDSPADLAVWYREVSVDDRAAVIEVLVSDGSGTPVADAAVSLDYLYYTAWIPVIHQASGVTDGKGAARLDLEFPGADWVVYFSGVVGNGPEQQSFTGRLLLPAVDFTPLFDVVRADLFQFATPGQVSTLEFAVFSQGVPLVHRAIYYAARTPSSLIAHGSVTTNATGRFELAFAAPPGNVRLEFSSSVGGIWAYDSVDVPSAHRLAVEIEDLGIGGRAKVRASLSPDYDAWVGLLALLPFEAATGSLRHPWVQASATWGFYHLAVSDGGVLEQEILLPRFLPKDVDYLLYAYVVPQGIGEGVSDAYLFLESMRIPNRVPDVSVTLSSNPIPVGSQIIVDASGSSDPDGALAGFRVDWGDGTSSAWSGDPVARHVYDRPGEYGLVVIVRDDNGAVASSIQHIQVEPLTRNSLQTPWILVVIALGASLVAAVVLRRRLSRVP